MCCLYWFMSAADFFFVMSLEMVYLFTHTHRKSVRCICYLYKVIVYTQYIIFSFAQCIHLRDVHSKMIIIKSTNRTVVLLQFLSLSLLSVRFVTRQAFILFLTLPSAALCLFHAILFYRTSIYLIFAAMPLIYCDFMSRNRFCCCTSFHIMAIRKTEYKAITKRN